MPTLVLPTQWDQAGVTILTSSLSSPSHITLQQETLEDVGEEREGGGRGMHYGILAAFLYTPWSSTERSAGVQAC